MACAKEIFGISPTDIDWDGGFVHVCRQIKLFSNGQLAFGPPKNGRPRIVPMPTALSQSDHRAPRTTPSAKVSLPGASSTAEAQPFRCSSPTLGRRPCAADTLTPASGGRPSRKPDSSRAWKAAATALRHHYASVLLDAGGNTRALGDYLGHSDPGFTLRTHTHLMPASNDRASPSDRRGLQEVRVRLISPTLTPPR